MFVLNEGLFISPIGFGILEWTIVPPLKGFYSAILT